METGSKKISVLLPVYNGGDYLALAVQSVLDQTFTGFEFLILDDASTDQSGTYLSALSDSRIRLFRNKQNKGLFYNLNYLVGQSTGYLIKLWSQDDIMYPHCLQRFSDFHEQYPAIGFSYSGRDIIDGDGKVFPATQKDETPALISPALHARIAFFTGSIAGNIANVCIRREALKRVGGFNEKMKISGDFDMWVRLAEHFDTGFIPEKLIQLRDHKGQLSRRADLYLNHVREDLQVYRYLANYATPEIREEGRKNMRSHKLVFYYTLMVKSLLEGKLRSAFLFGRELAAYDNFLLLTIAFLKAKIGKPVKPNF